MTQDRPSRPLLINGERLRFTVTPTSGGGGDKFEPQRPEEARARLLPLVQATVRAAADLPAAFRGHRLYVEARLLPNYLAASHFPTPLLSQVDAVPVGSREEQSSLRTATRERPATTRRLILSLSDQGLQHLESLMEQQPAGRRSRSDVQALEEIRKFDDFGIRDPASVLINMPPSDDEIIVCEAVLHPAGTANGRPIPLEPDILQKWFSLVAGAGGEGYPDYVRIVGGLTFAPVRLSVAAARRIARFNPLRALRPMPVIRPIPRISLRGPTRFRPPYSSDPTASTPRVAVFDGGLDIGSGSPFFPATSTDLTSVAPDRDGLAHGTGVGGAVMYGLASGGGQAMPPPLPVDHYRVYPPPAGPADIATYWMLDQIKATVLAHDYRLVNLSLGPDTAAEDSEPDRWTSELDQIAWERDALFVVASGNNGEEDQVTGLHRIQVPADMVNGLSVGACDAPSPDTPWARVPYSAMGPGRHGNRVQPGGVQFGGTDSRPFPLLTAHGDLLIQQGTSFAAPLVTHALSQLATRLPEPSSCVLRAFALHFAERKKKGHAIHELGYGRFPLVFREHLECRPNEVHVLYVDRIRRLDYLGYALPVPRSSSGPLEIELTLCYASPVDPTEPTEYTQASLELTLRPHQDMYRFTPPRDTTGRKQQSKEADLASHEAQSLHTAGWKMSQEPVTKTLTATRGRSEASLREGGKWETVRRHRLKLGEGAVSGPRLEVAYLARRTGALDNSPSEVPYALLVTVREPAASTDLYDRAVAEYRQLAPLPLPAGRIQIRAR